MTWPTPSRHARAKDAFFEASKLQGEPRRRFLEHLAATDPDLSLEVESLLSIGEKEQALALFSRRPSLELEDPSSPEIFQPGKLLADRYEIRSLRAVGGMGQVYLAVDRLLKTRVALKRLLFPSLQSQRQLIEEVLHARRVSHPAVCRVFDVGTEGGELFLTMEFLDGEDLRARLERRGALDHDEVRDLALELVQGLAAAHEAGVVHRDLKPANVVFDSEDRPHLTDFGIAASLDAGLPLHSLGTPGYLAPEALPPESRFSERSDLYALGLVVREALTGRPAFIAEDPAELLQHLRYPGLSPITSKVPEVEPPLARLIDWCVEPERQKRPASAADLERLLDSDPRARLPVAPRPIGRLQLLTPLMTTPGQGDMRTRRALDRLTGRVVAAKAFSNEGPATPGFLRGIDPVLLAGHAHFVPILEIIRGERDWTVVTPLLEGAMPLGRATGATSLDHRLDLLRQLFDALSFLHTRRQAHGNLHAGNVLVVEGRLKLLDLAAWSPLGEDTDSPYDDLRAALELSTAVLVGSEQPSDAAERILADLSSWLESASEPPGDDETQDDTEGWDRARRAAEGLRVELGLPASGSPDLLLARPCIGRDSELAALTLFLDDACSGRGRAVFIAGESGVGKTRLTEELRRLAWQRGMLVMHGQSVADAAGSFTSWRPIWRRLILECPLDDASLAMLTAVIPDLSRLLERNLPPAPRIEEEALQDRLLAAIDRALQGVPAPSLIVLEDHHWAGEGSAELLRRLARRLTHRPILIVVTLRPEEMPRASELEDIERLNLAPLADSDVATLSRCVFGADLLTQRVLDRLASQTEGNAFLLVETLREIAQDLDQGGGVLTEEIEISQRAVQDTLARRILRLTPELQDILRWAAIAGRRVDPALLDRLVRGPGAGTRDIELSLQAAAEAWILELPVDGIWRFRHDKLRELLLAGMAEAETERRHRRVARLLESTVADAARIAFHWQQAGDPKSALGACEKAGLDALAAGSHLDSIRWLDTTLELHEQHRPEAAEERGRIRLRLAQALHGVGQIPRCQPALVQALVELGDPIAQTRPGALSRVLAGLPRAFRVLRRQELVSAPRLADAAHAHMLLAETYFFDHDVLRFLESIISALLLSERSRSGPTLAQAAASLGSVASLLRLPIAGRFVTLAANLCERLPPSSIQGTTMAIIGGIHWANANWSEAAEYLDRGVEVCKEVGSERRWNQLSGWHTGIALFRDDLDQVRRRAKEIYECALRRGDRQVQSFGSTYLAELTVLEGRYERSKAHSREAMALAGGGVDNTEYERAQALLSYAHLAASETEQARRHSRSLLKRFDGRALTIHSYATVVYLAATELGLAERSTHGDLPAARKAVQALRSYAKRFPIGEPQALGARGRLAALEGKPRRARRFLERALERAIELDMPREVTLARRALEWHQTPNQVKRDAGAQPDPQSRSVPVE